jgi:tetratricopeptide (TPR) repeat protein
MSTQAQPRRSAAADDVDAGRQAISARRYLEAVRHLTRATAADPTAGEAFYLLGVAYWADDRSISISADKAVAAFQRAVAADADATTSWGRSALTQLAVSAVRSERLAEARRAYQKLLTIENAPDVRARYETQLEEIALDEGVYQPRSQTLRGPTGEMIGPIGPLAMRTNQWFEKGRHTQDPVKAEEYYRRAAEVDPPMWQAHLNYGIALARQRKFAQSLAPLAEAARRWTTARPDQPAHLLAHLWRLKAFLELDRLDDAAGEVAVLVTLDHDPWVQLFVLRYLSATGRADWASPRIEAILRDNPEDVHTLYALALSYRALGRRAEAVQVLDRTLACIPEEHPEFSRWVAPLSSLRAQWARD